MDYNISLKCPYCKKPMTEEQKNMDNNPSFPFCSKSCKMADLDKWFSDEFTISQSLQELDEDQINEFLEEASKQDGNKY